MSEQTGDGIVASDFDAYRRVRDSVSAAHDAELITALDNLPTTMEASLALSRALDLLVPEVWSGAEFEIEDGSQGLYRYRPDASQPPPERVGVVHLPFALPGPAQGFGGLGILSVWRTDHPSTEQDRTVAGFVLRAVLRQLEGSQLREALAAAERQAAKLARDGITGRRATLAVGILMEREDLQEADAESLLRRRAREHDRSLFDEAFHIVAATERTPTRPAGIARLR